MPFFNNEMTTKLKKKRNLLYNDIEFDSEEEIEFYKFLSLAKSYNYFIKNFEYQPKSFELTPRQTYGVEKTFKRKPSIIVEKTMYKPHVYTADFKLEVDTTFLELYGKKLKLYNNDTFYVDVKGSYNRHGGDRVFPIHQKLVYALYNMHVIKIVPDEFFRMIKTAPYDIIYMKNRKEPTKRKNYMDVIPMEDLFESADITTAKIKDTLMLRIGTDKSINALAPVPLNKQ